MGRISDRNFFVQPADLLAPALIGKVICRNTEDGFVLRHRITITEAYCEGDKVCDESDSQRLLGGHLYVTEKAMHGYSRFDIVANIEGKAEGVLVGGIDCYNGPGLAAEALDIDTRLNGVDLLTSKEIWIEDDEVVAEIKPPTVRKIGANHDAETKCKPHRFLVKQLFFSLVLVLALLLTLSSCGDGISKVQQEYMDAIKERISMQVSLSQGESTDAFEARKRVEASCKAEFEASGKDFVLSDEDQKKYDEANTTQSKLVWFIDNEYVRQTEEYKQTEEYNTKNSEKYEQPNSGTSGGSDNGQSNTSLTPAEQAWSAGYEDGYRGVQPNQNITKYVNYVDYYTEGWEYGYNDSLMGNPKQNPLR